MANCKFRTLLLIGLAFGSCRKEIDGNSNIEGSYSGTVIAINNSSSAAKTIVSGVYLAINNGNFNATYSSPSISAYSGSGKLLIGRDSIAFRDTTIHPAIDFDNGLSIGLELIGTYKYSSTKDSLILIKKSNTRIYTYKLKK